MDNKFTESKKYIEEMCTLFNIENPERLEKFDRDQLEIIFEGLLCGLNYSLEYFIRHDSFDAYQMNEILDGIRFKLSYEIYAKESFDWKKMKVIKTLLMRGYKAEDIEAMGFLEEEFTWQDINIGAYLLYRAS